MTESVCDSCGNRQVDLPSEDGAKPTCHVCGHHGMLTTNTHLSSADARSMLMPNGLCSVSADTNTFRFDGEITLTLWLGVGDGVGSGLVVHIVVEQDLMKRFLYHECLFHTADMDGTVDCHTEDRDEMIVSLIDRLDSGRAMIVTRHESDPRYWKLLTWDEGDIHMDVFMLWPRIRSMP